jgi:hypothetical protein
VNEQEQEKFEAELRRIVPAPLPKDLVARLQAAKPVSEAPQRMRPPPSAEKAFWPDLLHWLAPALALAALALVIWHVKFGSLITADNKSTMPALAYGLKADGVQVDQELVSSFDVVAKLPSGEPVRFRCKKWKDELVVTDNSRGIEIEQSSPRVEVVPVRVETY